MEQEVLNEWVERARAGDEVAFGRLVSATWPHLVALARTALAGHCHDAEDVVQEAFCQAWKALPELRSAGAFLVWIRRITLREAGRWHRRYRPRVVEESSLLQAPNQVDGDVAKALARLSKRQRAVLFLGEIEGVSDAEISETLGIRPATVRVHRQRARERLRRLLNEGDLGGGTKDG